MEPTDAQIAEAAAALAKAEADYRDASQCFLKCRAYSNKVYADLCCEALLKASDTYGDLLRLKDHYARS